MSEVKLFENKEIRIIWDKEKEEWYFSVVDVVGVLTESANPRRYLSDLKRKMKDEEGAYELYDFIVQLKLKVSDGKMRKTDVANTQGILRIIQSIPSPKAEPFKMWLAEVGKERIDEIVDPELTIDRALKTYLRKGYSREWINQRLQAIQVRKELTDSWINHGIKKGNEFAILKYLNSYPKDYKGLYSAIAISEYNPCDINNNYLISTSNDYYLKLINTNHQNKWFMKEDKAN